MAHSELEPPPAISSVNDLEISRESHLPPADPINRRLLIGLGVSILLNAILWPFAAQFVRHHKIVAPQTIEVTFVPRIAPHIVKPKRARAPHKVIVPPKPIIKPIPKPIIPTPHPHVPPPAPHQAPPQHQAHNRVLIGKNTQPSDNTALPGGNASPGKPTEEQNPGNDQTNTPAPPPPTPTPTRSPSPPQAPAPQTAPTPQPPAGPTKDAEPASQVLPDIPDDLKQDDFKSSVRVKVDINPDGSFVATLRSSSGNDQIDLIVLEALKKWKWKPALRDGQPVESIQLFRFDFEVN